MIQTDGLRTVFDVHTAIGQKKISVTELLNTFYSRIKVDTTGAFLTLCESRALERARSADEILAKEGKIPQRLPLFGIPIGIKDILTLEGVRTTCGSRILKDYVPPYTATVVSRLESAGAIILGKLNLDEFAMGSSNENSAFGVVRHPTHPDRVPGGSSGGSAAAVRSGLCVAALGTDTGGSIRLPASYCGILGVKPTYGRMSRYGQVAFSSSLDQIGPMVHSVQDAALLLDVLSGYDPLDSTSSPKPATSCSKATQDLSKLRIGIPKEYFIGGLAPDVETSIQKALKWFESQGAKLVSISLPHTSYAVAVYYIVAVSEASSNLARFDGVRYGTRPAVDDVKDLNEFYMKSRSEFGPEVKRRIILGTFALSSGYSEAYYKRACQVRRKIQEDFDRAFGQVDLILGPVSPTTAFKLGEKMVDPLQMYLNDIFTIPASLAGLPALSIPCGEDRDGLPVGLHMIARPFHEDQLLATAGHFGARHAS